MNVNSTNGNSTLSAVSQFRDNLLVTIGCRAGEMHCLGYIELPAGADGEDTLAAFATKLADEYMRSELDLSFDEFIESALEKRFAKNK